MSVRIVPLASQAAEDARMEGSIDARVAAVAELTHMAWQLAGRVFPTYTRATMPVVVTTLRDRVTSE